MEKVRGGATTSALAAAMTLDTCDDTWHQRHMPGGNHVIQLPHQLMTWTAASSTDVSATSRPRQRDVAEYLCFGRVNLFLTCVPDTRISFQRPYYALGCCFGSLGGWAIKAGPRGFCAALTA
ncbi:hypothetical protein LIER_21717 [Lithospermum erythrorhizon]|uniref:Uncharacterized protein n=1 Tax=Lithospermum erythrorhizon TaxID=34254 RepID=A0AAV3QR68_LITER